MCPRREDARYSPRFRETVRRRVVSELKEEIRLKLDVTGGLTWDERVRVKLLAPSWQF